MALARKKNPTFCKNRIVKSDCKLGQKVSKREKKVKYNLKLHI